MSFSLPLMSICFASTGSGKIAAMTSHLQQEGLCKGQEDDTANFHLEYTGIYV